MRTFSTVIVFIAATRLLALDNDEIIHIAQRAGRYDSLVWYRAFDRSQPATEPLTKLLTPAIRQPSIVDASYVFTKSASDYRDLTNILVGNSNFHLVLDERSGTKDWPAVFDKFKAGGPNAVQRNLKTKIGRFCVVYFLNQEFHLSFDENDVLIWMQQFHED